MADSPSELQFEIEKLERKHAENPEGRFFVPLANAYRKMGDVETAEALLRAGVERHPDYLSAHIVLGRCLADRGAVEEAQEEFRFVLSQDPQNLIALRTLGELAVTGGRPAEAADWYRELLAVDPMNEEARQALDTLSDAPAADAEAEFRSGAGWWETGADDPGTAQQPEEGFEAAPFDSSAPLDEASIQPVDQAPLQEDSRDGEEFQRLGEVSLEPSEAGGGKVPDDHGVAGEGLYGWDDLPGLRAEESTPGAEDQEGGPFSSAVGDASLAGGTEMPFVSAEEPAPPEERELEPFAPAETERSWGSDASFTGAEPAGSADAEEVAGGDEGAEDDEDDGGARYTDEGTSEVVTETIAELYARQGLHERAASVYRELIRRRGGDPALERRLAEIERLGREEEEAEEGLELADDEALLTPPMDAEDDPFAASFEDGFTTVFEDDAEEDGAQQAPAAGEGLGDTAETSAAAAPVEEWDEHPLPELAPEPVEDEPAAAAPVGAASGASIAQLLAGIASWRPSGPAAARPEGFEPSGEAAESSSAWAAPVVEEPAPAEPQPEPWETAPEVDEEASADLPYLQEATPPTAEDGTGSAEDEPFPWELPGGVSRTDELDEPAAPGAPDTELDPFFVDDVEPVGMRSDEALPEAPSSPPAETPQEPAAGPRASQNDPSEDEDLESFQAWLRSLKR